MIFVTVGSQLPFDRLIKAIDELAPLLQGKEIVAQVFGMTYQPKNIKTVDYISPTEYKNYIESAELIISHAGTGTILSVANLQKPMIVFPRLGKLKETRNNHQVDTCERLEKITKLQVAYDEKQLKEKLEIFLRDELPVMEKVPAHASASLLNSIKDFIEPEKKLVVASA
jgi:UDP-N-acetylglucosamine transferase subunit ALG13